MWKPEHRLAADRRGLRYPSDLTDAEWAIVAPMISPGRHGGRRRSVNVRERCCLNGGSSNERSRGSVVTVAWLATSNATQRPLLHSSASP